MKKIIYLITTLLLCSISSFAQKKGDMYLGVAVNASFGSLNSSTYVGGYYQTAERPENTELGLQFEGAAFVADNIRLSLAIDIPFYSTPNEKDNNVWLKTKALGVSINPNISRYFKLTDQFYYTPELGAFFEFGTYRYELPKLNYSEANYTGWGVYLNILAMEFRATDKLAIGMIIGCFSYSSANLKDRDPMNTIKVQNPHFSFNKTTVSLKYYF